MHCRKQFAIDVCMGTEIRLSFSKHIVFAPHLLTKSIPLPGA